MIFLKFKMWTEILSFNFTFQFSFHLTHSFYILYFIFYIFIIKVDWSLNTNFSTRYSRKYSCTFHNLIVSFTLVLLKRSLFETLIFGSISNLLFPTWFCIPGNMFVCFFFNLIMRIIWERHLTKLALNIFIVKSALKLVKVI